MEVKVLNRNNIVSLSANYELDKQINFKFDNRASYHGIDLTLNDCLSGTNDTSTNKYSNFYLSNSNTYKNVITIDRLSLPENRTVLCAELPCFTTSPEWEMQDKELGELVRQCLEKVKLTVKAPIEKVVTKRLKYAYPIYKKGYDKNLDEIERYLDQTENVLSFGRQGLFAHDNTHHALSMAYSAVACFDTNDGFNSTKWKEFRKVFETYVVVD